MTHPIPTHVILGFLGVGKSTAILDLLKRKPDGERWAVLVNEFGEVGIDGALLEGKGAAVKEIPGGCMCCVAGLPMQIGLNMLIQREKPDRLLIEPTGLGHPSKILETLTGEFYQDTLQLASTLCLIDPTRLVEEKVRTNVHFQDQAAVADVLVANKTDLCSAEDLQRFRDWAAAFEPPKARIEETRNGKLELSWLMGPHQDRPATDPHAHRQHEHHHHDHHHEHPREAPPLSDAPWQCVPNEGDAHYSCGWRIHPDRVFAHDAVLAFCHGSDWQRLKGVVHTDQGWLALNLADGTLSVQPVTEAAENRLEIIDDEPLDSAALDTQLHELAHL